jgi:cell division protein FtsB
MKRDDDYQHEPAALSVLEKARDNWKKATEVAIAAEKANRAKLEAERDKLKAEVERLRERIRFADQDCAAECAGLRGENAKLVERVSVLERALKQIADGQTNGQPCTYARASLARASEEEPNPEDDYAMRFDAKCR